MGRRGGHAVRLSPGAWVEQLMAVGTEEPERGSCRQEEGVWGLGDGSRRGLCFSTGGVALKEQHSRSGQTRKLGL